MLGVSIFFFKQKTAYEMRISDWSSDVCSSDLAGDDFTPDSSRRNPSSRAPRSARESSVANCGSRCSKRVPKRRRSAAASDRKSVVWGKSVSVRVDLGGRRIIKKKKRINDKWTKYIRYTYRHIYYIK